MNLDTLADQSNARYGRLGCVWLATVILSFLCLGISAHGQDPPQEAILAALDTSNQIVIFPDPANQPNTQILVQGLPTGARPQGVSYFASDRALVADFANSRIFVIEPSTGTLLSTITTTGIFNGTGTVAVSPDRQSALVVGNNSTLGVIRAPFNASSAISTVTLPGQLDSYQTQAIVFDNAGRAFVNTRFGISVLDSPYTSIAFTMRHNVLLTATGALAISPDGNTLLVTRFNNGMWIYNAPFSAETSPVIRVFPSGVGIGLGGINITPDGNTAITASVGATSRAFFVQAPFNATSIFEDIPLPADNGGSFEDVGISADGKLAILTGNSFEPSQSAVLIKAPFTAAETQTSSLPVLNVANPGRGAGAVRFKPPGLSPGLTISKTAATTVLVGGNLTYTISYSNTGTIDTQNTVISDPLPPGTTFVSATNGGELIDGNIVFNVGGVPAGGKSFSVSFTVTIGQSQGQQVRNTDYSIDANGLPPVFGSPISTLVVGGSNCPTDMSNWWRADGNTLDTVGGNTGTFIGQPAFTPGVNGQAFRFNPTDGRDAVNIPSSGIFRGSSQASIEAWVRPNGAHTNESGEGGTIFTENTSADGQSRFKLYVLNDGRVGVYGAIAEIGGGVQVISTQPIAPGQWNHIAGTWDSANGLNLYINGILAGSLEIPVGTFSDSDSSFLAIGSNRLSGNLIQSFNGDIDEVTLYTRALTAGEIFSIFTNSEFGKCRPLAIFPTNLQLPVKGNRDFSASGGAEPYTFSIAINRSGGTINSATGEYIAGSNPGVDVVRVTDQLNSSADATVSVEELFCSAGNLFIAPTPSQLSVGTSPQWVEMGDFNNDGNIDFIVTNTANPGGVSIRLGDGLGGFTPPPVPQILLGSFTDSVALGDFNNDGNLDFVTTNRFSNSISVRLGNGQGGFTSTATPEIAITAPTSVAIGDLNNDGNLDLVVLSSTSTSTVTILLGNGLGGFTSPPVPQIPVGQFGLRIVLGDLNNDGNLDFLASNQSSADVAIRLGDGTGGFSSPAIPQISLSNPGSLALGDFNGDGNMDFAITRNGFGSVQLRFGDGAGGFTVPTVPTVANTGALRTRVADMNNDGIPDLVVSANTGIVTIHFGDGLGGFGAAEPLQVPTGSSADAIAIGDINGDGKLDFISTSSTAASAFVRLNSCLIAPTSAGVSVSGRVLATGGRAIANASVTFFDMDGNARSALTNGFGYYRMDGLQASETFTVTVTSRNYQFDPQVVSPTENIDDLNFYARNNTAKDGATKRWSDPHN